MSTDAVVDFGPVPPLVVGVSGVMQFEGNDRDTLKREVSRFLWQFVDRNPLPGETPVPSHPDWRPLSSTPIAILTSLAPGADLLLAEIADELDAKYQQLHPGTLLWKFRVFAPMPFPLEQFKLASTFTRGRGSDADKENAKARLAVLDADHRAFFVPLKEDHTACEGVPETARKDATQAQLVAAREKCLTDRLNDDLTVRPRYRLRYRAAGEYIAAHSHLTLILNEQVFADEKTPDVVTVPVASELTGEDFPYGSRLILELKRQGITPELLRSEVAFTWADSGPVVHFYTPKTPKPTDPPPKGPPPPVGTMTLLHPVDSRTKEGDLSHADKTWRWEAGAQFATVLDQLNGFNREWATHVAKTRAEETAKRAKGQPVKKGVDQEQAEALGGLLTLPPPTPDEGAKPEVGEYRRGLDRLARVRRRASDLSEGVYSKKWKRFLFNLFLLTFVAALLVHIAGHWHTDAAHKKGDKKAEGKADAKGDAAPLPAAEPKPAGKDAAGDHKDPAHWTTALMWEVGAKTLLVVAAGLLLVFAYAKFVVYKGSRQEEFRFDFRALAEGVRVQVYWAAAGLAQSVPANYMQRQRNEMVWIRRAITALAAPYTRWANGFARLSEADQLAVLRSVVVRWVRWDKRLDPSPGEDPKKVEGAKRRAQAGYMERAGFEDHRAEHFWKRFGFDLALSGLFHLVVWVFALYRPEWFDVKQVPVWLMLFALALFLVFVGLWVWGWRKAEANRNADRPAKHDHGFPEAYVWRRGDGFWSAWWGGFVWARAVVYPYAYLWDMWHVERKVTKEWRPWLLVPARWLNAALVAACCTLLSWAVCVLFGSVCGGLPSGEVWWAIAYGTMLLAGALAIAWPERNAMAEHARQYESMWAMFQAAGRRLLGHLEEAQAALDANDLVKFRGRVKAIQELLYHIGLQALDENAEWLILHRSRPLEPLMAG